MGDSCSVRWMPMEIQSRSESSGQSLREGQVAMSCRAGIEKSSYTVGRVALSMPKKFHNQLLVKELFPLFWLTAVARSS